MLKSYTEFCFFFQSSVPTAHAFECRMMCMAERRCVFSSCKSAIELTFMFALLLSEILHVAMFSTWWFILTHLLLVRTHGLKPHGLLFYSWYYLHCLLSFARAATSILFVATNTCLPRQNVFCGDKVCLSRQTFCNKLTSMLLSRQKTCFVCLSWQNFCRNKIMYVATNICRDNNILSSQT